MNYQASTPDLAQVFRAVDLDNDGEINWKELQNALSNGTRTPFNPQTARLMISMFDNSGRNTIRFQEFGSLWKYVEEWKACFLSFDRDRSGAIDCQEFSAALATFGYRISPQLANILIAKYDRTKSGVLVFDDFIQSCVMLYMVTSAFASADHDRDGWITISYEQFLQIIFRFLS